MEKWLPITDDQKNGSWIIRWLIERELPVVVRYGKDREGWINPCFLFNESMFTPHYMPLMKEPDSANPIK